MGAERGKCNSPLLSPGPSSAKLKAIPPPSVNAPSSQCLARMPYTCSVSGGSHQSIWRLTYRFILGRTGRAGHLGSVSRAVTAAVRSLANDKLSGHFLLVRESQEESLRGLLLFSGSVSTRRRKHSGLWFYPQQVGARKGNSCGLFSQFKILVGVSGIMDPKYIYVRIPRACSKWKYGVNVPFK